MPLPRPTTLAVGRTLPYDFFDGFVRLAPAGDSSFSRDRKSLRIGEALERL